VQTLEAPASKNDKAPAAAGPDTPLSAQDQKILDNYANRRKSTSPVRFNTKKIDGKTQVKVDPPNIVGELQIMDVLATGDVDFLNGIQCQIARASGSNDKTQLLEMNFMRSVIKGIEPRDQMESMLATQMAAVHVAAMNAATLMSNNSDFMTWDLGQRSLAKLTKTFATQMETLKRYHQAANKT